jgi:hypothetical protein
MSDGGKVGVDVPLDSVDRAWSYASWEATSDEEVIDMACVAMRHPALPPLRATLPRTERRHVTMWHVAGAALAFVMPRLYPTQGR